VVVAYVRSKTARFDYFTYKHIAGRAGMPFFVLRRRRGEEDEASECFTKEIVGVEGKGKGISHSWHSGLTQTRSTLGQAA